MTVIYKICPASAWQEARQARVFRGSPVDLADGFIHFSTAVQVADTAAKHFAGQDDLLLVAVRAEPLGKALRYEASRGGDLFPHLYGDLPLTAVRSAVPLPLGPDGRHAFPAEVTAPKPFDPAEEGWVEAFSDNYLSLVGPIWARPDETDNPPGQRRFGFLAEERHLNRNGMVHGGMVMTFADHALGLAARSVNRTHAQATVQLDTAFLSGVEEGEFVEARCRMLRETKSILFMSAEIAVGDRAVANATGLWKIRGPEATPRGSI
ncbi:uncharacterized protein (TIGR00369 family) [Enterovirga rhinocerotis]|uniref:Uncharacterized protein (TIGR00369 family) n=2 Tax=Enterovirga rhinocerotis TaxID=1339210 RepID=A0A4R7C7A6_9HYPH|nr:uncharacterized protein (TIGR00369 family) [Enterovirga rhinocerotis]